ncbi:hypothetical protein [Adlercreutzia sp. ZJ473]|uniref:hypothetical protein n=1 Tax=Adlercreutzia sp. ZJ473 TaxID=2722822 RepID=UPI001556863D|nr:hypothetical protein [Adlercreutzia sp. ZJ473]
MFLWLFCSFLAQLPASLKFSDAGVLQSDISNTYNAVKRTKEGRGGRLREYWLSPDNLLDVELTIRILLTAWIARRMGCPEAKIFELFEYEVALYIGDRWAFFRSEIVGGADSLINLDATKSVQKDF